MLFRLVVYLLDIISTLNYSVDLLLSVQKHLPHPCYLRVVQLFLKMLILNLRLLH